jgi:hypothetical protein
MKITISVHDERKLERQQLKHNHPDASVSLLHKPEWSSFKKKLFLLLVLFKIYRHFCNKLKINCKCRLRTDSDCKVIIKGKNEDNHLSA